MQKISRAFMLHANCQFTVNHERLGKRTSGTFTWYYNYCSTVNNRRNSSFCVNCHKSKMRDIFHQYIENIKRFRLICKLSIYHQKQRASKIVNLKKYFFLNITCFLVKYVRVLFPNALIITLLLTVKEMQQGIPVEVAKDGRTFLSICSWYKFQLENGHSTPGCLTVQAAMRPSLLRRLVAHW